MSLAYSAVAVVVAGGALLTVLAVTTSEAPPGKQYATAVGAISPAARNAHRPADAHRAPVAQTQPPPVDEATVNRWAADGLRGFDADAAAERVEDRLLAGWLASHSHIDATWLAEHGMGAQAQRRLLALALSQGEASATKEVEGGLQVTAKPRAVDVVTGGSPLLTTERSLFASFALPEGYSADAVVVRWIDLDTRSVASVDRHPLSADASARQEVWMRPAQDWRAGHYRVEVFAADASLRPLAAGNYEIQPD
jgi:hypothetical protein